ncbi:MAG: hypothetical protein HN540_07970 [Rhodospirillaceae bacterium]|nr:hypothetical protein [Rhodospirillaceae bacterium]
MPCDKNISARPNAPGSALSSIRALRPNALSSGAASGNSVVAATLLLIGGASALTALQAMAVSTGFPFTIVLLAMCVSLYIGLKQTAKEGV